MLLRAPREMKQQGQRGRRPRAGGLGGVPPFLIPSTVTAEQTDRDAQRRHPVITAVVY